MNFSSGFTEFNRIFKKQGTFIYFWDFGFSRCEKSGELKQKASDIKIKQNRHIEVKVEIQLNSRKTNQQKTNSKKWK